MAKKFLITGGGTGGHLAVAEALLAECARTSVLSAYVGSTSGMDAGWFERCDGAGDGGSGTAGSAGKKGAYIKAARASAAQKLTNSNAAIARAYFLPSKGFVGCGKFEQIKALICLLFSTLRAIFILLRERPSAVIAVGGYSALPAALAAALLRRPLFLHEQNSRMGLANRLLARLSRRVFCAFAAPTTASGAAATDEAAGEAAADFKAQIAAELDKLGLGGLQAQGGGADFAASYAPYPLRGNLAAARRERKKLNNLLILGGSAGATALNELALQLAPALFARKISLLHQCGRANFAATRAAYAAAKIPAICLDERLRPLAPARFFATPRAPVAHAAAVRSAATARATTRIVISPLCSNWLPTTRAKAYLIAFCADMHELYLRADFAISRAGASALSELLAAAVPTLFVPYPFAAGNHQLHNALSTSSQGFALVCEQANLASAEQLLALFCSPVGALLNANLLRRTPDNGAQAILEEIHGLLG